MMMMMMKIKLGMGGSSLEAIHITTEAWKSVTLSGKLE